MTVLPEVLPVISMACRIGTPELTSVAMVRLKRATAIFWMTGPSFMGSFSLIRSQVRLPCSVFFEALEAPDAEDQKPGRR